MDEEIDRMWRDSMSPDQLLILGMAEYYLRRLCDYREELIQRLEKRRQSANAEEAANFSEIIMNAERDFMNSTRPVRNTIADMFRMLPPKPFVLREEQAKLQHINGK
jgi:hypothetical protein